MNEPEKEQTADSRQWTVDSGQCAVNRDGEASVRSREVRILWPNVDPSRAARPVDDDIAPRVARTCPLSTHPMKGGDAMDNALVAALLKALKCLVGQLLKLLT